MSQPSNIPRDDILSYHNPTQRLSVLAITSCAFSIFAIFMLPLEGLGIPVSLAAIVIGSLARAKIKRYPTTLLGSKYAVIGTYTGLAGCILGILAAGSCGCGPGRELSNRSVCAANLRGIMQSMNVYAADNNDHYPIIAKSGGYGLASVGAGTSAVTPEGTLLSMYHSPPVPSVAQNMWILVLAGQVAPKQFLCKSDPASSVSSCVADSGGRYVTNFNDGSASPPVPSDFAYSYSFAYPWRASDNTIGDWWINATDAGLPLLADMAPLDGTGKPAATTGNGTLKTANSFNHQRDGQNVAYGDSHAEFARFANVGQKNDNIYAASLGVPNQIGTPAMGGIPAIGTGGVAGAWDVCLVPAADANHNYARK
ncbi:MAG TPA: DUF4190 domain-containing protein [Phycisphaerae bacterium]